MDTTPLPNQESDTDGSALTLDYCIRLTTYNKFTIEQLLAFLENPNIQRYVVSRELKPQEHYHLFLTFDIELEEEEVKAIIKSFIDPLWRDPTTGKCPVGYGNKQYNCQLAKKEDRGVIYALKEANWENIWYKGYDKVYLEFKKAESFPKNKPSDFKMEYVELCEKFQTSDMDIRTFMTNFIVLKAKYGQTVSLQIAQQYALSNLVKRDPEQADRLVNNYLN